MHVQHNRVEVLVLHFVITHGCKILLETSLDYVVFANLGHLGCFIFVNDFSSLKIYGHCSAGEKPYHNVGPK